MDNDWLFFLGTILVSIVIYLLQRKIKKLSYSVILNTSLVKVNSEVKDKIQLTFEGNKIENPYLIFVRFINNGNQYISASDFEKSIKLIFSNDTKILQCEATDLKPDNLALEVNYSENTINIDPLLINPNEEFTLKLIIDSPNSSFEIIDRIKGLNIKEFKEPFFINSRWLYILLGYLICILYMYYFTPIFEPSSSPEESLNKIANLPIYALPSGFILLLIIYIPDIYVFFKRRKFINKN